MDFVNVASKAPTNWGAPLGQMVQQLGQIYGNYKAGQDAAKKFNADVNAQYPGGQIDAGPALPTQAAGSFQGLQPVFDTGYIPETPATQMMGQYKFDTGPALTAQGFSLAGPFQFGRR